MKLSSFIEALLSIEENYGPNTRVALLLIGDLGKLIIKPVTLGIDTNTERVDTLFIEEKETLEWFTDSQNSEKSH